MFVLALVAMLAVEIVAVIEVGHAIGWLLAVVLLLGLVLPGGAPCGSSQSSPLWFFPLPSHGGMAWTTARPTRANAYIRESWRIPDAAPPARSAACQRPRRGRAGRAHREHQRGGRTPTRLR